MFKTNHKPYTRFTYNAGNTVANSSKTLKDILGNTMDSIEDLRNLEKDLKEKNEIQHLFRFSSNFIIRIN